MMIHLLRTARVVLVALACASCGSSNRITSPSTDPQDVLPLRTLTGVVSDAVSRPIAGVRIAIVGTSLSTVTGDDGRYELTGGMGVPTTVLVTKEGYAAETHTVIWLPDRARDHLVVSLAALSSVDISGDYTMTLSADSACADLPSEARSRTYTASIVATGPGSPRYRVTVRGDSVVLNSDFTNEGGVVGDFVALNFFGYPYGPTVVDQIAPNTYVSFLGTATSTVTPAPSVISAAFVGNISYCSLKRPIRLDDHDELEGCGDPSSRLEPTPSQPVTYASCESKNHRLTFTRR